MSASQGSIPAVGKRTCLPIDSSPLKLNSDSKTPVRQTLAVNNASQRPQIAHQGTDHQPLVQFFGLLRQEAHSQRAYVLRVGDDPD